MLKGVERPPRHCQQLGAVRIGLRGAPCGALPDYPVQASVPIRIAVLLAAAQGVRLPGREVGATAQYVNRAHARVAASGVRPCMGRIAQCQHANMRGCGRYARRRHTLLKVGAT